MCLVRNLKFCRVSVLAETNSEKWWKLTVDFQHQIFRKLSLSMVPEYRFRRSFSSVLYSPLEPSKTVTHRMHTFPSRTISKCHTNFPGYLNSSFFKFDFTEQTCGNNDVIFVATDILTYRSMHEIVFCEKNAGICTKFSNDQSTFFSWQHNAYLLLEIIKFVFKRRMHTFEKEFEKKSFIDHCIIALLQSLATIRYWL